MTHSSWPAISLFGFYQMVAHVPYHPYHLLSSRHTINRQFVILDHPYLSAPMKTFTSLPTKLHCLPPDRKSNPHLTVPPHRHHSPSTPSPSHAGAFQLPSSAWPALSMISCVAMYISSQEYMQSTFLGIAWQTCVSYRCCFFLSFCLKVRKVPD